MARDYLPGMASSVPAEELFSGGVDLITPNRISLKEHMISKMMCLKWY
jgi:hypothetical protein